MWTTMIYLYVCMFPVSVAINSGQDRSYFEAGTGKLKDTYTVRAKPDATTLKVSLKAHLRCHSERLSLAPNAPSML